MDYWLDKHLKTGVGECEEFLANKRFTANSDGNQHTGSFVSKLQHERTRFFKLNIYNNLPLLLRPILYFIHRYFVKLGFLMEGLDFLTAFSSIFLSDARRPINY